MLPKDRVFLIENHLKSVIAEALASPGSTPVLAASTAALRVIEVFLGQDWVDKHLLSKSAPTDFFKSSWGDPDRYNTYHLRVTHLAEMLLNLQMVSGFNIVRKKLKEDDPEAGYAELETGKLLAWGGVSFSFREPTGERGNDYDLNIMFESHAACADTKCKVETTRPNEITIVNSLSKTAKNQLPDNEPGLIFLKCPHSWFDHAVINDLYDRAVTRFLRNTRRVVAVYFYHSLVFNLEPHTAPILIVKGYGNVNHRFDRSIAWAHLFDEGPRQPDGWIDIFRITNAETPPSCR